MFVFSPSAGQSHVGGQMISRDKKGCVSVADGQPCRESVQSQGCLHAVLADSANAAEG